MIFFTIALLTLWGMNYKMRTMKTIPLSYIEISKANVAHNLVSLRGVAKPGTKFAVAVKGNAYGHGLPEIVRVAEKHVDYFIVNSIEELREVRKISKKQTFVLGYVMPSALGEAIQLGCILSVFSQTQFLEIEKVAKKMKRTQEVHIACDSLLGREGFLETELADFLAIAKKSAHVHISGMYSHFANIEDTNNFTHAQRQIDAYTRMRALAEKCGYSNLHTHISATSGLLAYEKSSGINTIVRVGIGMYGLWPSEYLKFEYQKKKLELKPILSWKTHIAQIKTIPAGRTIGYGLTYMTTKKTRVALVPQGYADGFPRALSNKGCVLIGGKKCHVLGRVSMNMFVVDISKCYDTVESDEVVLLGSQGKSCITAEEIGEVSGTINYEVTTRISPLLPRIIV